MPWYCSSMNETGDITGLIDAATADAARTLWARYTDHRGTTQPLPDNADIETVVYLLAEQLHSHIRLINDMISDVSRAVPATALADAFRVYYPGARFLVSGTHHLALKVSAKKDLPS